MTQIRKFVAALVLGLAMCLTLFTTGAFAHGFHGFHGFDVHHQSQSVHFVSINAVAEAGHPGLFGRFGHSGFFGHGLFDAGHAFAHTNVHVFDFDHHFDHFNHFETFCGNHCN